MGAYETAETQRSLAALYVGLGQIDAAAQAIRQAQAVAAEIADPVEQGETLLVLAQVQEARKAPGEAEQSYDQAIACLSGPEGQVVAP